jgi:hypothetical protein
MAEGCVCCFISAPSSLPLHSTPNTMADALQAAAAADQLSLLMAMQQHQQHAQLQAAAAAASAAAAAMPPMPLAMGMPPGASVDQLQMLLNNPAEMNRCGCSFLCLYQAHLHLLACMCSMSSWHTHCLIVPAPKNPSPK